MLSGIKNIIFDMGGTLELGRQWYPDALPALKRLSQNYRLFILANQGKSARSFLEENGAGDLFDGIYLSGEVNLLKPEKEFFQKLLLEEQLEPKETLMVGDDLENDVAPAQALGMQAVWVRRGPGFDFAKMSGIREEIEPDYEVDTLADIK